MADPVGSEPAMPAPERDLPPLGLTAEYEPPFAAEALELSAVLRETVQTNIDLGLNAVDVEISEARVLAALGAYDVFITSSLRAAVIEQPQRGSAFAFNVGSRTIGANLGITRRLETGGTLTFRTDAERVLQDQPINFQNAALGTTTLTSYTVRPMLQLSHPLLRGAGLKVNRADIDKARVAVSQAEAQRMITAQDLASQIISAYWDVLFAHRDLLLKRRSVKLAQQQLDRTRALVSAGRLSPVDAKAVEQAMAARESDVLTAENTLLDRSLTLRTLMGQQFADRDVLGVLPTTDPVVMPRAVDVRAEVARALETNPQVRRIELGMASLRIDELVTANGRLPQLTFDATFQPQGRSIDRIANAENGTEGAQGSWSEAFRNIFSTDVRSDGLLADWSLSGSLTLNWDVQNRTPRANHEIAKLQIVRAEIQLAQARQQVAAGVIRAANSLRTAAKVMDVADISRELAEDNLAAEQARFEVGRSTNFDVLRRLDELDAASTSTLSAQINYLKALVQLQALNGEILPAYGLAL